MRKKKKEVIPIITGVHPREKQLLKLHCHPDAILESAKELVEMSEDEGVKFLMEDLYTLAKFAISKTHTIKPPKDDTKES